MIGQVKTINGVKQIVSVSGENVIDSVTDGSMLPITSNAVYDALSSMSVITKMFVSSSDTIDISLDTIIYVVTSSITVTLSYITINGLKVEVHAMEDCTIEYYVDSNTVNTLSMGSGTSATFIFYNGWKFDGIYGAVWN